MLGMGRNRNENKTNPKTSRLISPKANPANGRVRYALAPAVWLHVVHSKRVGKGESFGDWLLLTLV